MRITVNTLDLPDGIGNITLHYFDGSSYNMARVQYDTIGGGGPHGCWSDLSGEFEDGRIFHAANVAWWEVI